MKLYFKILPPNFAITDKGKFSLATLDDDDFEQYCKDYLQAIKDNRERQFEAKRKNAKPRQGYVCGN